MIAAIASALHILSLVGGMSMLYLRGVHLGGSWTTRLLRLVDRRFDVAMTWIRTEPQPPEDVFALDARQIRRILTMDSLSLIVMFTWVGSGLWRWLGGLDKPVDWYMTQPMFQAKMALLLIVGTLECVPMVVFMQWRYALGYLALSEKKERENDSTPMPRGIIAPLFIDRDNPRLALHWVPRIRWTSRVEFTLLLGTVFVAAMMTRGVGPRPEVASSGGFCAIEQVLAAECLQCHGPAASGGLSLHEAPYDALVDVTSSQWPTMKLVVPGHPEASLVAQKLSNTQGTAHGSQMPLGRSLEPSIIALVQNWIADGAKPCEGGETPPPEPVIPQ